MCLDYINSKKTNEYKKLSSPIEAYKIVEKTDDKFISVYAFLYGNAYVYKVGVNTAQYSGDITLGNLDKPIETYESGFHCYLDKQEALKELESTIRMWKEIKFRLIKTLISPKDVICVGTEVRVGETRKKVSVIVSRKMTIKSFNNIRLPKK